jgi:hypothetical protein
LQNEIVKIPIDEALLLGVVIVSVPLFATIRRYIIIPAAEYNQYKAFYAYVDGYLDQVREKPIEASTVSMNLENMPHLRGG